MSILTHLYNTLCVRRLSFWEYFHATYWFDRWGNMTADMWMCITIYIRIPSLFALGNHRNDISYSCLAVSLCDCVSVWLCGCVAVSLCGCGRSHGYLVYQCVCGCCHLQSLPSRTVDRLDKVWLGLSCCSSVKDSSTALLCLSRSSFDLISLVLSSSLHLRMWMCMSFTDRALCDKDWTWIHTIKENALADFGISDVWQHNHQPVHVISCPIDSVCLCS